MNRKFLWFFVFMFILLGTFAAASADQDGRNCWCNIDEYGCRITGDDGGVIYIMFWSEEARQYIMGAGSAPYDLVVEKPSQSGILALKCGIPSPVIIPTAGPDEKPQEPAYDCSGFKYEVCFRDCDAEFNECQAYAGTCEDINQCNHECLRVSDACYKRCQYCNNQ